MADWTGYGFQDLFEYTLQGVNFGHFNSFFAMTEDKWNSLPEHKNLVTNAQNLVWEFELDFGFKQIIVTSLFHVAAISCMLIGCSVNGTTVIQREFDAVKVLNTIEKDEINSIFLVPAM